MRHVTTELFSGLPADQEHFSRAIPASTMQFVRMVVEVTGSAVAELHLQCSIDGETWADMADMEDIEGPEAVSLAAPASAPWVRLRYSGQAGAGEPGVVMATAFLQGA